jgi:hypothetical protein
MVIEATRNIVKRITRTSTLLTPEERAAIRRPVTLILDEEGDRYIAHNGMPVHCGYGKTRANAVKDFKNHLFALRADYNARPQTHTGKPARLTQYRLRGLTPDEMSAYQQVRKYVR